MPTDLLLAAFALTLIANAVLVVLSIRAMRRGAGMSASQVTGSTGADRELPETPRPRANPPVRPGAGSAQAAGTGYASGSGDAMTAEIARAVRARRQILGEPTAQPPTAQPPDDEAPSPLPKARARPATRPTTPRAQADGRPATASRRSRRKFSLPPLDDDHEKVSRSIESFLTGGEPPGSPAEAAPTITGVPTTVALVALTEAGPSVVRDTAPSPDDADRRAAEETARAIIERTLRGAARGSDTVTPDDAGRFRIVLAGTGELAARAYLRRIRATVEPLLEASATPLRLVMATATVLEEPLDAAVETAGRRLEAAVARLDEVRTRPEHDGEDERKPRAAGD